MNLCAEIEKVSSDILLKYEKDALRITNKKFVTSMINFLARRSLKYEARAKELEIRLLINGDRQRVFKRTYRELNKQLRFSLIDIKVYIPRREKIFKTGLVNGVKLEHELFVNCFKQYEESEV